MSLNLKCKKAKRLTKFIKFIKYKFYLYNFRNETHIIVKNLKQILMKLLYLIFFLKSKYKH